MFNIGGGEFLVIGLIALIVLGPQRLPDAARQVGKAMGELRRLSSGFQNELKDAIRESESTHTAVPRRDVLGSPADSNATITTAVSSVSAQRPARRAPLRATPQVRTTSVNGTTRSTAPDTKKPSAPRGSASTTTASSAKTSAAGDTAKKAARPRTKGS